MRDGDGTHLNTSIPEQGFIESKSFIKKFELRLRALQISIDQVSTGLAIDKAVQIRQPHRIDAIEQHLTNSRDRSIFEFNVTVSSSDFFDRKQKCPPNKIERRQFRILICKEYN